jgi:hypothetical protein
MRALATVRRRIYTDFLMPSRLGEYRHLLESALEAGYVPVSIERYWPLVTEGALDPAKHYLILRHDIDTDPQTAALMWRIERSLGIESSHFFRLSTLDVELMRAIEHGGGRASYHYEELATVARRRRPRNHDEAALLIPEARALFALNLARLRMRTGLPMDVVASHGDFLNRKLVIKNTTILADTAFRREMGITIEPYDKAFLATVSSYHRDALPPAPWMHGDPFAAIARAEPVMYVLIHPRPWRKNLRVNALDDLNRLRDEVLYRLPLRRGSHRA